MVGFLSSILFSNKTSLTAVGFLIGGKAFITTYLFHRFPKLRKMFDVVVWFYDRLPTTRDQGLKDKSLSSSTLNNLADEEAFKVERLSTSESFNKKLHRDNSTTSMIKLRTSSSPSTDTSSSLSFDQSSNYDVFDDDEADDFSINEHHDDEMFLISKSNS